MLNFNVGILGHVDSGKTSLARVLSTTASTAAFDKHPQSQERGITLDLGFSCFTMSTPHSEETQVTLVDCPGHASLIKTVIGGAQIIDLVLLVVDAIKGVQTQTAECLLLAQITCPAKMIVVINKIDLIPTADRQTKLEKLKKRLSKTLESTTFKDAPIVCVAAAPSEETDADVSQLTEALRQNIYLPDRCSSGKFLMAIDHCFGIRGQGTILTGTVLSGRARVGDQISIPALQQQRKVKSMQIFRRPVDQAVQGDRAALCVTQLEAKQFERGLVCEPGAAPSIHGAIVTFNRIGYYKPTIPNKSRFHVSIGHETVMAKCSFFEDFERESREINFENEYGFVEQLETQSKGNYFALLEFEHPVLSPNESIYIASRLDTDIHSNTCRLAFHGRLLVPFAEKNYASTCLPRLKVFKNKQRQGVVERLLDNQTLIVNSLFKKETNMDLFTGLKVRLSTGENGYIEGTFGQSGKVKARFPQSFDGDAMERLQTLGTSKKKQKQPNERIDPVFVLLDFKRYVYDPKKAMIQ